ncbi:MAG: tetratricopeptide repeat protein [Paenibacillus sp.]|nr:tetratricopeptide repeat protein [Paenibacillus sp.]
MSLNQPGSDAADTISIKVTGYSSVWQPCPLMHKALNAVLAGHAACRSAELAIPTAFHPMLSVKNRITYAIPAAQLLTDNNNGHADRHAGEELIRSLALFLTRILRLIHRKLHVACEKRNYLSSADRMFLREVSRCSPEGMTTVYIHTGSQPRSVLLQHTYAYIRKNNPHRVFAAALQGIDRAMRLALYKEALARIRLSTAMLAGHLEFLPSLMERKYLVHMILGQKRLTNACLQWLYRHSEEPAVRSGTLLTLAVQQLFSFAGPDHFHKARRFLAEARVLESLLESPQKIMHISMRLNTQALWFYRKGRLNVSFCKLEESYQVLLRHGLLRMYEAQGGIVCANAVKTALKCGRKTDAYMWTDRLAALAVSDPLTAIRCSRAFFKLERWSEAVDWIDISIARSAPSADLWVLRAQCYLHLEQPQQAIKDLNAAEEMAADDIRIPLLRAVAHEDNGNYTDASASIWQALRLNPRHVNAWADLARIYWLQGKRRRARTALLCGLRLEPSRADLQERLNSLA